MPEDQIEKGVNVFLYYWTIPVLGAFAMINYFTENIALPPALDLSLMISVVSFLFGFLITITFSMLLARVSNLKIALSDETGRLVSLFHLSKHLGADFHRRIVERIDQYNIKTLKNYTNYEVSREMVYGIHDDAAFMEIKSKQQEAAARSFFYVLGELQPVREKLESLTARRTEWSLKFANYLLGSLLIILLFLNRGDTFTNIIFIILSTTVIFIFLIIEDYDNLKIGDYTYNISNAEQIFDMLGRDRYYPTECLPRAQLIPGKKYRIGIVDGTNEEKIVTLQYSPDFEGKVKKIARLLNMRKSDNKNNSRQK